MIKRIHHVQITVPVGMEEDARRFYCNILGLREIEKPSALKARGGLWLLVGKQQVHIGIEEKAKQATSKAHIAYEVDSVDNWRTHLEEQGVEIGDSIPIPGAHRFEFRDPFGNRIELVEAYKMSASQRGELSVSRRTRKPRGRWRNPVEG